MAIFSFFIFSGNASAELLTINLPGGGFSPFSKGCIKSADNNNNACILGAISSGGYAIYDYEVRADAKKISVSAQIENPSNRKIDVYIYNYGKRTEDSLLSKPNINRHWLRWETVIVDKNWKTRSPEFLETISKNGEINLLGPHNIIRLLFYADPGLPPKNEVFIIDSVSLNYQTTINFSLNTKSTGNKVWKDDGKLYSYGTGNPPSNAISKGQAKAMAKRAAIADAERNLLSYLRGIPIPPFKGSRTISFSERLAGATTEKVEHLDNGSVKITISVPIKRIIKRAG